MLDGIWHLDQVPPPAELILSGNDIFFTGKGGGSVQGSMDLLSLGWFGKMARKPGQ
jgi:hypothetical protein